MNEPKRLLDDPSTSAGVRELLANAPPAPPLDAAIRAQVADSVVHVAASVNAAGASAIVGKWIIAGVTAVAVVGGGAGIWAVTESGGEPAPEPTHAIERRSVEPRVPEIAMIAPSEEAPVEAPDEPALVAHEAPPPARPRVAPPPVDPPVVELPAETPPRPEGMTAEARALEEARQLLARDPSAALAKANAHRAEFPDALLAAESDLIAIDALVRLGRTEEARSRGRSLLARRSFYADRVRALVGDVSP